MGFALLRLKLLESLPYTPERIEQELYFQVTRGQNLIAVEGFAAPEVERCYARVQELCQQTGDARYLFQALSGLRVFYQTRGRLREALELVNQYPHAVESIHHEDPAYLVETFRGKGVPLFWLGEFASSLENLRQGIALYNPQQQHVYILSKQYPLLSCLSHAALALWHLGYPEQALHMSHKALDQSKDVPHHFDLAFSQVFAAWLYQCRGEEQKVQELADEAITLSTKQGLALWLAEGTILRGWAIAMQGQAEAGIAQIQQGLTGYRATGAELALSYFLGLLAVAHWKAGQAEEGLKTLGEALAVMDKSEERFDEAELYRLQGELLLALSADKHAEAEDSFRQALDIARRQQAKSWELRVARSLSRLSQQRNRAEARQLLWGVYNWFTEGFDTVDLQEARALLDKLS